jgi:hypothetical protein
VSPASRATRRQPPRGGLPLVLALLLAGCPPQQEPPAVDDDGDPPADTTANADASPDDAGWRACSNREYGFQVRYPARWAVNQANGLPPCSAFDPDDASMPVATDIPRDLAVVIRRDQVAFQRATDFDADPTVQAVSREAAIVDGRRAVVAELQHTGQGMYAAGERQYAYFVDLDPFTLIAVTHGIDAADPPPYQERQRILDDMMASIRFQPVD